ncbi:hypothetical protein C9374_003334 [Naegleria lovaniensis]|uniref:VWFA domain-containing protein n=1 Tax=Naegleria lovaniensis TaxID=51637 RepID=A0AA88GTI1_NAELO|nr:uncharacterized protein C9374_003334 [Naegleria lovaniensis]KAG2385519.1 hypothetical protein C9374_003334 [Naegleria lovaniensis]
MSTQLTFTGCCEYPGLAYPKETDLYCVASIQAPEYEADERKERAGIDLVCVIDKSGSMSGSKIELVKSTLAFMFDQLKPTDRVALVEFDSSVITTLAFTNMNEDGKQKAKQVANNIHAGTCTNLSGGLFEGLRLIKQRTACNEVTSILLFTDGLANEGITNTTEIVSKMNTTIHEEIRKQITCFTFGFGSDTDANMLTSIAQAGNGLYYFLNNVDDIPKAFGNVIGGLVSVVAQNIKVKIMPNSNVKLKKVFTTFRKTDLTGGTGCEIAVGDIYSEEKKDLVFVLTVPALNGPVAMQELAKLQLQYFNVINTDNEGFEFEIIVNRQSSQDPDKKTANYQLDIQRNRVESGEAMEQAKTLSDQGKLEEGRKLLTEAIAKIEESVSGKDEFCVGLVKDLTDCKNNMVDRTTYSNVGSKMLNNYWSAQMCQRATSCESSNTQAVYMNKKKAAMTSAFSSALKKK